MSAASKKAELASDQNLVHRVEDVEARVGKVERTQEDMRQQLGTVSEMVLQLAAQREGDKHAIEVKNAEIEKYNRHYGPLPPD